MGDWGEVGLHQLGDYEWKYLDWGWKYHDWE